MVMQISDLIVEKDACGLPEVAAIQSKLGIPGKIVDDLSTVFETIADSEDSIKKGKRILVLKRNKGAFIKDCPGTRAYTCCGYQILHIGSFCTMDCSYCILQSYFHPPVLQYFVNHTDLFDELGRLFSLNSISRVGTGEFTDSLIWEAWSDLTPSLVRRFAGQHRAVLELKTKTVAIDALRSLQHGRKTIVSWSVNTAPVLQTEERRTTPLSARLAAARQCESWGYPLAFHFDPIILYEGCEADYQAVVHQLFSHVSPENIVWISLGTFRFMPSLKKIIQKRFPRSKIVYGEFIPGLDGKMRYFKPLRIQIYQKMISWIRQAAPNTRIYFCMEDDEVWQKTMGYLPAEFGGLPRMLDDSAVRHCGLSIKTGD
jgi:spore photoproduct lyase